QGRVRVTRTQRLLRPTKGWASPAAPWSSGPMGAFFIRGYEKCGLKMRTATGAANAQKMRPPIHREDELAPDLVSQGPFTLPSEGFFFFYSRLCWLHESFVPGSPPPPGP